MSDLNTIRDNFTLGRGDVFFAKKRDDGTFEGERLVGNVPALKVGTQSQSVKHYSSRRGMRTQDRDVPTQTDYSGSFDSDDVNPKNVAALFLGSASVLTQTALAAQSQTFTDVEGGLSYQLGMAGPGGAAGLQKVSITSVKSGDDVTTYAEGTDYTQDGELGRVTVIVGGAITDGSSIKVHFDRLAANREQVVAGSQVIQGYLRFIAYNAEGADIDYYLPNVKLAPNGDFTLIDDQNWLKLSFNLMISADSNGVPIYANGRAYVPA